MVQADFFFLGMAFSAAIIKSMLELFAYFSLTLSTTGRIF